MKLFRSTLRVRMALLYGGLVLLVGVSLLFTSLVLLDRAISGVLRCRSGAKTQNFCFVVSTGNEVAEAKRPHDGDVTGMPLIKT